MGDVKKKSRRLIIVRVERAYDLGHFERGAAPQLQLGRYVQLQHGGDPRLELRARSADRGGGFHLPFAPAVGGFSRPMPVSYRPCQLQ